MKDLKITMIYTLPSIFLRIAKSADVTDQFRTVQTAITGAAPMDSELQQAANAKLGMGDVRISQTWSLSETTGAVTAMPRGDSDVTGSISPILPSMEMRIVDDEWNVSAKSNMAQSAYLPYSASKCRTDKTCKGR
jgi:acyl-CoA synthetase (AMP-forming)/AMP-acid ligase II